MKLNEGRYHLLRLGIKCKQSLVTIADSTIKLSDYEKPFAASFNERSVFTKSMLKIYEKGLRFMNEWLCIYLTFPRYFLSL